MLESTLSTIEELLKGISNAGISEGWNPILEDIKSNPLNYEVITLQRRIDHLTFGKDDIPHEGKILIYEDNEHYGLQSDKFKERFPELATEKPTALVERCRSLSQINSKIVIGVARYLIQEKA